MYIIIFLSAIRRLSIIPQNTRFSSRKRYGSIFILSSIYRSMKFFFFFFDRRCKFVLSLSFVFFFYYYNFPSDISGRTRGVLGHPQKWRITVNVNFWGAERVKRCVYRRLSRGIYFVCCWRGKYFLRVQWRLNEMPKFFLETSSVC